MKTLGRLFAGEPTTESAQGEERQRWVVAIPVAAALVGVGVFLSAVVNPMFGRYVHWDWTAVLAPVLFVGALAALRRRWV